VCRFAEATGKIGAIGQLTDTRPLLGGRAGTIVTA
jgi:carbamate kinase